MLERCAQRPVSDIERLIKLRVGHFAADIQERRRRPALMFKQPIEQIHSTASKPCSVAAPGTLRVARLGQCRDVFQMESYLRERGRTPCAATEFNTLSTTPAQSDS